MGDIHCFISYLFYLKVFFHTQGLMKPQMPKRPIMARNIGMGRPRRGLGGINRARLMARYPRLLRKKVIRLPTIDEVPEEILHEAVS